MQLTDSKEHLMRPRLNALLAAAIKKPLTIVCASMGCGKTQGVYDFIMDCGIPTAWVQLSESDNSGQHFWDNYVHAVGKLNKNIAKEYKNLGLPNTEEKVSMYFNIRDQGFDNMRHIFVFDDVHFIKNPFFLHFMELTINRALAGRSIILISREMPALNLSSLMLQDKVSVIDEADLNFTEDDVKHFLLDRGLAPGEDSLKEIYNDTKGWAISINYAAELLKKTPSYSGYVQDTIRQDISQTIEKEFWNVISPELRSLLLRISLSDHSSAELIYLLAEEDESLVSELKQQNTFIHSLEHMGSFQIHQVLLDFLYTRQGLLSLEEKQKACEIIADWCVTNDYTIDAIHYYEKAGDYNSIVSILYNSPPRFLMVNAGQLVGIFDNAPEEVYDTVELSAAMHIQLTMGLLKPQDTYDLIRRYEAKYLELPGDGPFKNRMLGSIYYLWGILRLLLCSSDDRYDFDVYYSKVSDYLKNYPLRPKCWYQHPQGLWTNLTGTSRAGAPVEFINSLINAEGYIAKCLNGLGKGVGDLGRGELLFYQGNTGEAEFYITTALGKARENGQYEIVCRALFYLMRIALAQGEYSKLRLALEDMEGQLINSENSTRYLFNDLAIGWYYYNLNKPDNFPLWLKDKFTYQYNYANSFESFGSYIKAKYYWLVKNYTGLLEYIDEKKRKFMVLFERIELLVKEACVHFKMKDMAASFGILLQAYETAMPNHIIMPFIEGGKDMQLLINASARNPESTIPLPWLDTIKLRIKEYVRNRDLIISEHEKTNEIRREISLSPRENSILLDLHNGLSRVEIAAKYGVSVNTVKLQISSIYSKTGARNRADIVRIAEEHKLV